LHRDELKGEGIIIFDGDNIQLAESDDRYMNIPLTRLAEETAKNKLTSNTVAAGAAVALAGGGNLIYWLMF
jgi:Pyruvate/2-oxoacid:ferredoxin oxidoreductase gamma subunit